MNEHVDYQKKRISMILTFLIDTTMNVHLHSFVVSELGWVNTGGFR